MSSNLRVALAAILLASTARGVHARGQREVIPQRQNFSSFPRLLGDWTGTTATISPDTLAVLGPGDFLLRSYESPWENTAVDLFLAYFPSQKAGDTIHSPKHCLPGGGWLPFESSETSLSLSGRRPFRVNRYLVAKGGQRALVIYWYRSGGRAIASEYRAKFYLVADSLRFNRSDGALVRVSTLIQPNENAASAERRLISLLTSVVPVLDDYIPS